MTTHIEDIHLDVDDARIAGMILRPQTELPGILFVHGWGGSQQRDLGHAMKLAGLGCICLTFDLRGHEATDAQRRTVSREQNLADVVAAYDRLAAHPALDRSNIAVIGTSYGGYLATLLSALRPVRWLALRVPAIYPDGNWNTPKQLLDREALMRLRHRVCKPDENQALTACEQFDGDVLLVESEHDRFVPHTTIMNYRNAFALARSMTHRLIDGADHALSREEHLVAYDSILNSWVSEMVIGSRTSL
ncbi:alpha/beta hydrolase family protein [Halopseudomonas sp.]|uniref:alpha/beta hydrolase family protein n=1 Tax=Halopseudomonas sp. TaxID=2901191 RepID=UPI003566BC23